MIKINSPSTLFFFKFNKIYVMPFEKKEKIQIVCQECGKKIYVMPWRAKKQKYCSMECYNVVKSRRLKLLH